jgi:K+-transporting ATPase KdpF subunit
LHYGHLVFVSDYGFLRNHGRGGLWLRASAEAVMTLFYAIGAVVSLLLFVYLVVALLKPELFS